MIEPVGANGSRKVDVRVIAATNRNLSEEVKAKRFREDLYYRICPITLKIPPLRERRSEITPIPDGEMPSIREISDCPSNSSLTLGHDVNSIKHSFARSRADVSLIRQGLPGL
jgi:transcriptional regulator of acetoin/glycerol metabolism